MARRRFDEIVSLGRGCQPAHQIRRIFDIERAHIFDWIMTPDEGLRTSIRTGLEHFFERDRLVIGPEGCIVDATTNIQFMHEFPDGLVADRTYAEHAARFSALVARWQELMSSSQRVLFVRQHAWAADARASAVMLRETLDAAAPALDYTILYLTENEQPAWNESRIVNEYLHQMEPYDWRGDDRAWSTLFNSVEVHVADK
ncbi:MAG: hypothetical protein HY054_08865 [Proteobacteria bacterium]|nr:hypothetical protein [Pseudomonadota bacterium]